MGFLMYMKNFLIFKNIKNFGLDILIISEGIQKKSIQEKLAEDIISIIHSFSGKLYGMRKK